MTYYFCNHLCVNFWSIHLRADLSLEIMYLNISARVCFFVCLRYTYSVCIYIYAQHIHIHIHIYTYTYTSTYHVYIYIYTYTRITCVMISIYIHTLIHLPIKFVFLLTILLRRMDIPASNLIQSCSFPEILHYIDSIGIYPV